MRVVAVGDSIAYGVGDHPTTAGAIAWSGRLARLAGSEDHRIFGYPGAVLRDLQTHQLPAARMVKPDLILMSIGGNDAVRTGFDANALRTGLVECLDDTLGDGTRVALATLPDFSVGCRLPRKMRESLHRRIQRVNAVLAEVADRPGVTLVDRWADPVAHQSEYLHADRVHPSPLGYQRLAERTLSSLGIAANGTQMTTQMVDCRQRLWLLTSGVPWAIRRSSSLLPGILAMARDELRSPDWSRAG